MWRINFNFMTKVTLMAVILIVLTASTMGIAAFSQSRGILVKNQLQELGAHAEVNSVRLVAGIDALRHDVVFVSKLPAVDGVRRAIENGGVDPVDLTTDALWRTQLMAIFAEMLESKPHYVQMQYIAADGLELVHVERADDVIRSFGRRELGFDIADDFFVAAQAIANDQVYLSDIRLRRSHDELIEPRTVMMYGSTPIYGSDGSVFGVIAIGMDFGTVFDEMLAFKEDSETLYVTNQAGELLLNSADSTQTFGFETGSAYRIQENFAYLAPLFEASNTLRELPASPDTSQGPSALHYLQVPFDPLDPARYLGLAVAKPYDEIVGEIDSFVNQGIMLTVFLMVCGIILAIFIARILIRPLYRITAATQQFSEGRFDVYLPDKSGDEFGQLSRAFNLMSERIRTMIDDERRARQTVEDTNEKIAERILVEEQQRTFLEQLFAQIADVINTLHSVSAELQSAATQQSASANEQAATVTQAVTTVEETHTTVRQTAERAQNVTEASQESVKVSRVGREAVNNSIQGMEVIRHQVADIAENILMLAERTQQIGEIIETVNALADQSKLLALNASIEAARAGEEGRGFAVVAMEVRQLAEQSRDATQRVRDILGEIQQATNSAVMVTEEGTKAAERGARLVEQAGETIEELAQTLELAAQSSTQIAASTRQQSSGMEQLMAAMQQIRQASMQNASTSRQIEESTRHLLDIANQLQVAVESHEA